jgi:hypothetical protein
MDRISTPRGSFKIKFKSMTEASANGFYLWFEHDGYAIVGDGTHAYAVDRRQ